jgi:ribosomal protein L11 methylase PrmA
VYADEPPIGFDVVEVEDVREGWENEWRAFHHGVTVGRFWVGPPWEEPPPGLEPVVVDPGRAFGTGAHPTTRLSLELLQTVAPGSLLDVGCGSGVLSIGAAKLGFGPVTGVDANVALDVVERLAPRLAAQLFVASGYLDRDMPDLAGWEHADRRVADGWAADLFLAG